MKKSKGSVDEVFAGMLVLIVISILLMAYLNIMELVNRREDISQIARQYILRMETVGYLKPADRTTMEQALADMGMKAISLEGTSFSDVGYGNPVILMIQGELSADSLSSEGSSGSGLFQLVFQEKGFPINIKKMSTAKN